MRRRRNAGFALGFTLMELMIVVAVIGILAAVAGPEYSKYLMRSRRADATQLMLSMDTRQKQLLVEQRAYAAAPNALNVATTGWTCNTTTCTNTWYQISYADAASSFGTAGAVSNTTTPPSFTICAKPIHGSQTPDGTLTLTHDGQKRRIAGTTCTSAGTDLGW